MFGRCDRECFVVDDCEFRELFKSWAMAYTIGCECAEAGAHVFDGSNMGFGCWTCGKSLQGWRGSVAGGVG